MPARPLAAGDIERAHLRAVQLRTEAERKERAVCRKAALLAAALGRLMEPGMWFHRRSVAVHAFDVDGSTCLASSYLEEYDGDYRYRYAVLCRGERAKTVLRTAPLDPSCADEPGAGRRVALATYEDCLDFLDRLPIFLTDLMRSFEERSRRADRATADATRASEAMRATNRRLAGS